MHNWSVSTFDSNIEFFQGEEIEYVYIKPPPEECTKQIWKFWKCISGFAAASFQWYQKAKITIWTLKGKVQSAYDKFPDFFPMATFIDSTHMKF